MRIIKNASLRPYNTFGVAARTRYLAVLECPEDVFVLIEKPFINGMPRLILGGGSNLLFRQDFQGVVALVRFKGIQVLGEDDDHVYMRAAAGEDWHGFVLHTLALNYGGLENLSLIPGTVGAAPIQNIGAYGVELSERFESLEAMSMEDGRSRVFDKEACQFGYRTSVFKLAEKNRYLITSVTVKLSRKAQFIVHYAGVSEELARQGQGPLTAQRISEAICRIRRNKLPDPAWMGNAGSFFKNPLVDEETLIWLRDRFPKLAAFPQPQGGAKLSAAWLIEQCGWKGYRSGDAGVCDKHALVLVNYGRASGREIWQLAEAIITSVEERFGIRLEPEPLIV